MKKNLKVTTIILVIMITFLFSCNAMAAKYVLRAAHQLPETFAWQDGLEFFADKVKEYSGGEAEVLVYGNAVLGQEQDYIQNMMQGVLDFAICAPAWGGTFAKELEFFSMPFLFKNIEHWKAALDGEIGAEMAKIAEKATGLKTLGYLGGSARSILSRVGPIEKPSDLKGFKLRVMSSPIQVETWKALDASPTPLAYAEVYSALQQGVIDGMENEMATLYSMKFYEVAEYISLTEHTFTVRPLWMSGKTWDRLPVNIQAAIVRAAKEAVEFTRDLEWKQNEEKVNIMKEKFGVKFNEVSNREIMFEKTQPIREKVAKEIGAIEMLKELQELAKKY